MSRVSFSTLFCAKRKRKEKGGIKVHVSMQNNHLIIKLKEKTLAVGLLYVPYNLKLPWGKSQIWYILYFLSYPLCSKSDVSIYVLCVIVCIQNTCNQRGFGKLDNIEHYIEKKIVPTKNFFDFDFYLYILSTQVLHIKSFLGYFICPDFEISSLPIKFYVNKKLYFLYYE